MSQDYAPACERNVKETVVKKKMKNIYARGWNGVVAGSLLPRHDDRAEL
jgi:hypothetical protein